MPPWEKNLNKSLKVSFLDGIFASGMVGFTQDYFIPFLLLMGGTARSVGILSALPNFAAALVQLKVADFTERIGSRKRIVTTFVFWQAMILLPMAAIASYGRAEEIFFIILVTLFTALGAFAMPPWGSLMSDLVAEDKRGEYFGWRNKVLGFISVVMTFIAGFILHILEKINIFHGFLILFFMAFIFRMMSWYFLTRMDEPKLIHKKEHYFNMFMFLRRIKESNFAKFVLFVSVLNFSVNVASPFFAVFMLRDLKFNYLLYTLITVTATLTVYLLMGRWGKHADKVGNLKVMKLTAPIIATLPLWWIINHHPVYLILIQIISGFAWAGFNLCASNFIYDAVSPEKRTRCIAYFNVLNGLSLCLGALLGGFLIDRLPSLWGYKILTLFIISSCLRMIVALIMPMKLIEVRPVEKIRSYQLFFSMIGMRPLLEGDSKTVRD